MIGGYSNSIEKGETAPANTANVNQILSPYRDREYEAGAKFQVAPGFLITAAGFRMTRPLADTSSVTNIFSVSVRNAIGAASCLGRGR